MPTGPKHQRFIFEECDDEGHETGYCEDCRCMIGEDHNDDGSGDERLAVHDARDLWMSSGMDEDKMFGYSESELRRAAGQE